MNVWKHYIEEMKSGDWRLTHVRLGGLMPSKGPHPTENGQILIGPNRYTVNSDFDHKSRAARPGWALGLVAIGIIGLFSASATAQYPTGAIVFGFIGIIAILVGILNYQESLHIWAYFAEGSPMQIPQIRKWFDREKIDQAIGFTSQAIAEDAKSQLGREILQPEMPWTLIIAAAIAGLGGGAIIGVIVAHIR